jgi:hypothetical protein
MTRLPRGTYEAMTKFVSYKSESSLYRLETDTRLDKHGRLDDVQTHPESPRTQVLESGSSSGQEETSFSLSTVTRRSP